MSWQYLSQQTPKNEQELLELLLTNRHIEDAESFLHPPHPRDISPEQLGISQQQLEQAVARIDQAIAREEQVVIIGDYDADGITATAMLWLALNRLGAAVVPFIPDRQRHGYGLSVPTLKEIQEQDQPDLIITVDNGIVAHEAVAWANQEQIDVIITDHHQAADKLPSAQAIIHSTQICGAAVAWFLVRALSNQTLSHQEPSAKQADSSQQSEPIVPDQFLDLVAIATIADQMQLTQANRSFAKYGLQALRKTKRTGLRALYQVAKVKPQQIKSYTVGFVIAPRINAIGRLKHGLDAVRLLCTGQRRAAQIIAKKLDRINSERQHLTKEQFELALQQVGPDPTDKLLVVSSDQFHEGIIGLIAGKLTEKFHRPSIAISTAQGKAKGSARSVKGVNITDLIKEQQELLISAGGHELAAGFSAELEHLAQFKEQIMAAANQTIERGLLRRRQKVECQLPLNLVSKRTVQTLQQLQPFGLGNFPPVFALEDLQVVDAFTIGQGQDHLKLMLRAQEKKGGQDQEGSNRLSRANEQQQDQSRHYRSPHYRAIAWRRGKLLSQFKAGRDISVAANLEINHWNGKSNLQLKIKDFKF
jgi:single-stranded-DNA-specific exonuclease